MKIIFMGTPDFAVPCLKRLVESEHDVVAVFSQPDKPVGRKQIMTPPPVKECAVNSSIQVYQPVTLRDESVVNQIKGLGADIIVVVAYGKILPTEILEATRFGCINVHASLLPQYRGAAPIQWAILNGDKVTGVTVQQMNEGVDTGDIILTRECQIDENETSEELFDKLSHIGADALIDSLKLIEDGTVAPVKQNESLATHTVKITRDLCPIEWNRPAEVIHNQVRGLQTWPCASTTLSGKQLKIHKTVKLDMFSDKLGTIVDNNNRLVICCGDGKCLEIVELQLEGKKRMDARSFLQGNNIKIGQKLGE